MSTSSKEKFLRTFDSNRTELVDGDVEGALKRLANALAASRRALRLRMAFASASEKQRLKRNAAIRRAARQQRLRRLYGHTAKSRR